MGALTPKRRKKSAREAAEQFEVTPRTVRKYVAEPRADYLARAKRRRAQAVELRSRGLSYAEIAERTGQTVSGVESLLRSARAHGESPAARRGRAELAREEQERLAAAGAKLRRAEAEHHALIRELREAGATTRAIAEAAGLSPYRVSRILGVSVRAGS